VKLIHRVMHNRFFPGYTILLAVLFLVGNLAVASAEEATPSAADALQQNLEDARKALRFGIDSTVVGVIRQAISNKDVRLKDEVKERISSANTEVQLAVVDYFVAIDDGKAILQPISEFIVAFEEQHEKTLVRFMLFLEEIKTVPETKVVSAMYDLAKTGSKEKQSSAIRVIGSLPIEGSIAVLRELFDRSGTSVDVRVAIMQALGKKKDKSLLPFFRELYEDSGEDKQLRREALGAIGLLADQEGLKTIRKAITSQDLFERKLANYALDGYDYDQVKDLYLQGLRDASWQNRLALVLQIKTKNHKGLAEALVYMAEKDPEKPVRLEAMRSLVQMNTGWDSIKQWIEDAKASTELRSTALSEAMKKYPEVILPSVSKLIDQEWKVDKSRLLELAAKELAMASIGEAGIYARLLEHKESAIRLLAVRGIIKNKTISLHPVLKTMLDNKPDAGLKAAIEEALKK